jgi:hypothetical protein
VQRNGTKPPGCSGSRYRAISPAVPVSHLSCKKARRLTAQRPLLRQSTDWGTSTKKEQHRQVYVKRIPKTFIELHRGTSKQPSHATHPVKVCSRIGQLRFHLTAESLEESVATCPSSKSQNSTSDRQRLPCSSLSANRRRSCFTWVRQTRAPCHSQILSPSFPSNSLDSNNKAGVQRIPSTCETQPIHHSCRIFNHLLRTRKAVTALFSQRIKCSIPAAGCPP